MTDLFTSLSVGGETLSASVKMDDTLKELSKACDYTFTGESIFTVPSMIPPATYKVGLIVGGSGTGKSSLLKHFGSVSDHSWNPSQAVASQVDPAMLMKVGLSSIPSLCRPYHVLSEGEKHRADIAQSLALSAPVIDEFTSTVHRDLARSICIGLRRYIDKSENVQLVLATCHEDVEEWLCPDWIFNTNTGKLVEGRLERHNIQLEVYPCSTKMWPMFSKHHYLTGEINKGARCWLGVIDDRPVCFGSAIPFPRRNLKNGWRDHRLVVLPDYQGMGLGSRLSDLIAFYHVSNGSRYFAKTAHPALGEYRERSDLWKPTSMNKVVRTSSYLGSSERSRLSRQAAYNSFDYQSHAYRVCYSHEYIGDAL